MEVLGYIFGMSGMTFALIAFASVMNLKKELGSLREEVNQLKQQLRDAAGEGV